NVSLKNPTTSSTAESSCPSSRSMSTATAARSAAFHHSRFFGYGLFGSAPFDSASTSLFASAQLCRRESISLSDLRVPLIAFVQYSESCTTSAYVVFGQRCGSCTVEPSFFVRVTVHVSHPRRAPRYTRSAP